MTEYIEREAAIDEMRNHIGKYAAYKLKQLPAVDAAPVKHGKWFGTVCTACGESTSFYYDCEYCPHCGAKMEKGEENV